MDTERFELTLAKHLHNMIYRYDQDIETGGASGKTLPEKWGSLRDSAKQYYISEATKVLSLLESVELEAPGDRVIERLYGKSVWKKSTATTADWIVEATISKNQTKGQLYRIRSEKE